MADGNVSDDPKRQSRGEPLSNSNVYQKESKSKREVGEDESYTMLVLFK